MATRLSPSRASDFKQCPQLYKFKVIDRLEEPPSRATLQGTIVHHALERLFDLPAAERTVSAALSRLPSSITAHADELVALAAAEATETGPDEDVVRAEIEKFAGDMIEAYFELENPALIDPVARELRVTGEFNGTAVMGIIDRLDQSADGTYVVTDYKTGKAPAPPYQEKAFFGLRVYAALLEGSEQIGEAPAKLRLMYLKSKEILEMPVHETQIRGTKSQIAAIAQAIESAIGGDLWPARTSRLCDWCYFKPICPAFQT